ncbi:hypothetical protein G6F56_003608 [Rhizopus delemar]|nr:hypothetical protein G6F56_003608 [Rhizopus delemar]
MEDVEFEELLQQVDVPEVIPAPSLATMEDSLDEVIGSFEARFQELTGLVNMAVKNRQDDAEVSCLMAKSEATNQQLQYFIKVKGERSQQSVASTSEVEKDTQSRIGLTLSRRVSYLVIHCVFIYYIPPQLKDTSDSVIKSRVTYTMNPHQFSSSSPLTLPVST